MLVLRMGQNTSDCNAAICWEQHVAAVMKSSDVIQTLEVIPERQVVTSQMPCAPAPVVAVAMLRRSERLNLEKCLDLNSYLWEPRPATCLAACLLGWPE